MRRSKNRPSASLPGAQRLQPVPQNFEKARLPIASATAALSDRLYEFTLGIKVPPQLHAAAEDNEPLF